MLVLKNKKKGYILLETLIAFFIFFLLITASMSSILCFSKIKNKTYKLKEHSEFLDALNKEVYYKINYEDMIKYKHSKAYLKAEYIDLDFLKQKKVVSLFTHNCPKNKPYVVLFVKGEDVLSIDLDLIYEVCGKEKHIKSKVFKGRFRR